jgi:carbon-monoxide dehydrogenase catalytic subunit
MLGGSYRSSFRPLNDAIMSGRIRGVVADVGCNNPRTTQDATHDYLVRELLKNDVLVVETGCGALASGKAGFMLGEAAMEHAGPGLREVCEATGMPPVLHMGSCVDNTRILTVLTQIVEEGGLGDDISDVPAVGIAPEWMSEKALAIASYCVASGAYVIMGINSPVEASQVVTDIMSEGWEQRLGGKLEFIVEPEEMLRRILEHIDKKRAALKLPEYDRTRFGKSGDKVPMAHEETVPLTLAERQTALYGEPVISNQ